MEGRGKTRVQLLEELRELRQQRATLEEGTTAEVREKLVRLGSFPEYNPDPVIELDLDGNLTYLNPLAQQRFPDLPAAGLHHPMLSGLPSMLRPLQEGQTEALLREIAVGEFVYEQKVIYLCESALVRIYAHDITERKRAEAAVRSSEERFHAIFEHSNDAIFLIDPAKDEIIDINSKACRLLGYTRKQLLSLPISAVHPHEMSKLREFAQAVFAEGRGWTDELKCLTSTSQVLPAEISASVVDLAGRRCIIALVRDLTERERAEQILADEVKARYNYEEIVGKSAALQEVLGQVELVAATDTSVLLLGETGTGKELICRAIHHASARRSESLVKLNCAAIPSGLIESELFGHERGAFTGAISQKRGRFELAHGGTIFLDEIGDIPLETQPKLLRLLQEREFERVGGTRTIEVDVRVIAATHRDLGRMVEEGTFRRDLFYRLNVFPISLPPLRERREDILALAKYFAHRIGSRLGYPPCEISEAARERLLAYAWPGNVRELENIIERALILCRGRTIDRQHILVEIDPVAPAEARVRSLEEVEKEHILAALRAAGGRVSGRGGAAEMLGLKPTTLESRMKKLGLRPEGR
ncbi:MAG: sigma 54-interacting transcriptional regulator [Candidatus Latescibacteria bacterium]|nr:sigma 54-interacting transcriptional regulator [Candidatus Latescibacterota bacterium]